MSMGMSAFYRVIEQFPEIVDSLVVDLEGLGRESYLPLFVVLTPGVTLDDALKSKIKAQIRSDLSPRHGPDDIFAILKVPRTLNGKKLEVPEDLDGHTGRKGCQPGFDEQSAVTAVFR